MHIVLVGLNHKSAPVELRERLAFQKEQLPQAFSRLRAEEGLTEAAILSTCNRVEIYAAVATLDGARNRLQRFLSEHGAIELDGLAPRLYSCHEPQSVRHLFSVASGLDSMILGEGEILCQVKHAYEWAREGGATGKVLNAMFQRALNAAKAVRSQTAIGRGCASIGSVAVELAAKIFGRLRGATVLLIGAGKVGELTLKRLAERGVRELRVMNRSAERAAALAAAHGARAAAWDELPAQLWEADVVISSTAAPACILRRDHVALAMRERRQRPLCLVDLGVPRNIEASAGDLENVYLFNVDDLQGLVDHSYRERLKALEESQAIIDRKVTRFLEWWRNECPVSSDQRPVQTSLATGH
jgi:glutamyl-tRNA reductase